MDKCDIDRINELARKAKCTGLTEEEKLEQQMLRKQYIADFKQSLRSTLENVVIVDPKGNRSHLKCKPSQDLPVDEPDDKT
ncbi:MAG: DUF896 domain-containing protein [Acetivibrionales bacterium]